MHVQLETNETYIAELVWPILLPENGTTHPAKIILQKITNLGCDTLLHLPYTPGPSPADNKLFKHLNTFGTEYNFWSKPEVEPPFIDIIASKLLLIHNLVDRWKT